MPQTITAWAACWVGDDDVQVQTLAVADFYDLDARRDFLQPLADLIGQADVVTGHNILRFDLPVLNADMLRVGLPSLQPVLAQDTMRGLPRTKGFKKGQDVLAHLLKVPADKLPLHWGAWASGYAEPDRATIRERVVGDVRQHMLMREAMRERGWLGPPKLWRP